MASVPDGEGYSVATVPGFGGRGFSMAVGDEATFESDPLAFTFRSGRSDHMTLLYRIAAAALRPGGRVLDLGAHLGGFALAAAGYGCEVIAVEAAPRNAELLRWSVAANGFGNMRVVHATVGRRGGVVQFAANGPYGRVTTEGQTVSVRTVRVDDVVAEAGFGRVDFVKLDVEGYELEALRGMGKLLARKDAPPVFFESNSFTLDLYGLHPNDLSGEFRRHGYTVYAIGDGALSVAADDAPREVVVDYFAAKRLPAGLRSWVAPRRRNPLFRLAGWLRPGRFSRA